METSKDQESLSMMNDEEIPDSQDEDDAASESSCTLQRQDSRTRAGGIVAQTIQRLFHKETEESDSDEEEESPFLPTPTVIKSMDQDKVLLTTCFWREVLCKSQCRMGNQHYHVVYDKNTVPREFPRTLLLRFCKDKGCWFGTKIHTHQGDDELVQDLNIPQHIVERIWGKEAIAAQTLCAMHEGPILIPSMVDDRADARHMYATFDCDDTECPYFHHEHYHYRNVDPEVPYLGLETETYQEMLNTGLECYDKDCQWAQYLHAHFGSKNE